MNPKNKILSILFVIVSTPFEIFFSSVFNVHFSSWTDDPCTRFRCYNLLKLFPFSNLNCYNVIVEAYIKERSSIGLVHFKFRYTARNSMSSVYEKKCGLNTALKETPNGIKTLATQMLF